MILNLPSETTLNQKANTKNKTQKKATKTKPNKNKPNQIKTQPDKLHTTKHRMMA